MIDLYKQQFPVEIGWLINNYSQLAMAQNGCNNYGYTKETASRIGDGRTICDGDLWK